jgi:hypothetical protein
MVPHIVTKAGCPIHAVDTYKNAGIAVPGHSHGGTKLDFLAAKRFRIVDLIKKAKRSSIDPQLSYNGALRSRSTCRPRHDFS